MINKCYNIYLTSSFFATHQRKHALRCYQQALYVYRGKSWSLAEVRRHAILFDKCSAYVDYIFVNAFRD